MMYSPQAARWLPVSSCCKAYGAQVIGAAFLMEIEGLHGRDKLGNIEVCSLVKC